MILEAWKPRRLKPWARWSQVPGLPLGNGSAGTFSLPRMILTAQLPVSKCHEQIGDPTLVDGILDRLVHNAHRIETRGESIRKKQSAKPMQRVVLGRCVEADPDR